MSYTAQTKSYSGPEKRYLPRWEVNNRVLCRVGEDIDALECRSVDLSCSGVCLILRQYIKPQEHLKLTIYLTEAKTVEIDGHVVWSKVSGYGNLIGINFENITLEMQDTILKYAFEFKKKDLLQHWFEGWNSDKSSSPSLSN